ncbi:MAG: 4Fe-4S binding protein [Victivallales bacterium]
MSIKELVKSFAYEIGADLVGFGNIERCKHAPLKMSPQGILPEAKTVIVMGIHHPDACIELGGEEHPQKIGPYSVQYLMNSRLDEMSYRMATFIEEKGYGVIPICSSNIWRYNKYKELDAVFAPDVSHIYMPVVAGLADMGYNGLALTPEYGARNRFITVITDAEIEPDPLIPPGTVCDKCMLCRKHCPSQALSKEINGDKVLKIENYEYRFANKNLWRCAWGEHFDLDLDLELPEKVTEEVIVEYVRKYGVRSGEMGQCLKFCVPKKLRTFDRSYSKTPMRKYCVEWNEELEPRKTTDRLIAECHEKGIEHVVVESAETLRGKGINIGEMLPGAKTAITLVCTRPQDQGNTRDGYTSGVFSQAIQYHLDSVSYDLTRKIEELGFRSLMTVVSSSSHYQAMESPHLNQQISESLLKNAGCVWYSNTVYTHKTFPERTLALEKSKELVPSRFRSTATLTSEIKDFSKKTGADLVGISSARRIAAVSEQLKKYFEGEKYLKAVDKSHPFKTWEPEITEETRHVFNAEEYLPGAKSVIVIGLRFHKKVLEYATKPPAEAVGPYAFQTYITRWQGGLMASKIARKLNHLGYKSVITPDLMGLGSAIASPRGFVEDMFCNRFSAVAAGLGALTKSGRLLTEEFGIRQRFIAIITDAELEENQMVSAVPGLCAGCERCVKACPTHAISADEVSFECDGAKFCFNRIDTNLCEWSKRYAITGESGFKYLGSPLDESPGGKITAETLSTALKKHDPIKKYRPVVCEPCVIGCPYSR